LQLASAGSRTCLIHPGFSFAILITKQRKALFCFNKCLFPPETNWRPENFSNKQRLSKDDGRLALQEWLPGNLGQADGSCGEPIQSTVSGPWQASITATVLRSSTGKLQVLQ